MIICRGFMCLFFFRYFRVGLWLLVTQILSEQFLLIYNGFDLKLCWMYKHDLKMCTLICIFNCPTLKTSLTSFGIFTSLISKYIGWVSFLTGFRSPYFYLFWPYIYSNTGLRATICVAFQTSNGTWTMAFLQIN